MQARVLALAEGGGGGSQHCVTRLDQRIEDEIVRYSVKCHTTYTSTYSCSPGTHP